MAQFETVEEWEAAMQLQKLRLNAYWVVARFQSWPKSMSVSVFLDEFARLLGASGYTDLVADTEKYREVLEALIGVHGHAVWKMLRIRRDESSGQ